MIIRSPHKSRPLHGLGARIGKTARELIGKSVGAIARSETGIAMVEFAVVLPVLLTLGLFGTEVVRMSTTKMKVNQIALSLADNASRLGQTDNGGITPSINETMVDAIIQGALRAGQNIDLEANGRVILSSLEFDDFSNRQYIHWQRCRGDKVSASAYGDDGSHNGLYGATLTGMGRGTVQAASASGSAVMFVEIYLDYEPMLELPFSGGDKTFTAEAAFIIRDDRNLTPGVTGTSSTSSCS